MTLDTLERPTAEQIPERSHNFLVESDGGRVVDMAERVKLSPEDLAKFRAQGIQESDFQITETESMRQRNRENEARAREIAKTKSLQQAERAGMESLKGALERIVTSNELYKEKRDFSGRRVDIIADSMVVIRRVYSSIETIEKAIQSLSQPGRETSHGIDLLQKVMGSGFVKINDGHIVYGSNFQEGLENLRKQLVEMKRFADGMKENLIVKEEDLLDPSKRTEYFKGIKSKAVSLNKMRVGELNNSITGFDEVVFDTWVVKQEDWFNEQKPENFETAAILAAKFAGSDYQPGGKYALYDYVDAEGKETRNYSERIRANPQNMYLLILDKIKYQMWFQGPDATVNAWETVRVFETPWKPVGLLEFLFYDVEKYTQRRMEDGTSERDEGYKRFLLYTVLHVSGSQTSFNAGVEARNSMTREKVWLEFFEKFCTGGQLATSNRALRLLKSLSAQEIKEHVIEKNDWATYDGTLGQAMSEIATLHKYVVEFANGTWNIGEHAKAIQDEENFYASHGNEIIDIKVELSRLRSPKGSEIARRALLEDRLSALDDQLDLIQKKQNFFFKSLGTEKQIKDFLYVLVNRYMTLELRQDEDAQVREMVDSNLHPETAIVDGNGMFRFLSVLDRSFVSDSAIDRAISDNHREILRKALERRGLDPDLLRQFLAGVKGKDQNGVVVNSDTGIFINALFNMKGNRYKQGNLNLYTELGVGAKSELSNVLIDGMEEFMGLKYKEKLTGIEVGYAMESGRKIPDWMMVGLYNDTSISGNVFHARIAHLFEYYFKNYTHLPAGLKETLGILMNTQNMWNGVPVEVTMKDKATQREWTEVIWFGDFIQRSMTASREEIVNASFPDQAFAVFWSRRVEPPLKMYTRDRKEPSKAEKIFNPGKLLVGYFLGDPLVDQNGLEEYLQERNVIADFLYESKYPMLYKRRVREWHLEYPEGSSMGKAKVVSDSRSTEKHLLGKNVFLMRDALKNDPDIKVQLDSGDIPYPRLLQLAVELNFIGSTLRSHMGKYMNKSMRDLQGEDMTPISAYSLKELMYTLTLTKLGKLGIRVHRDEATGREEYEYVGKRMSDNTVKAMLSIVTGVPFETIMSRELNEQLRQIGGGFLWVLISALFGEVFKAAGIGQK